MTRLRQEDILSSIDSWTDKFQVHWHIFCQDLLNPHVDMCHKGFLNSLEDKKAGLDAATFQEKLSHFLFSPVGAKYRAMFKFDGELVCGQPAPQVGALWNNDDQSISQYSDR